MWIDYIFQTYKDYLINNSYLLDIEHTPKWLKLTQGQISIQNNVEFINQPYAVGFTNSKVSIRDTVFRNTSLSSKLIRASESELDIQNITLLHLQCPITTNDIFYIVNSILTAQGLHYTNSNWRLVNSIISVANLKVNKFFLII